MMSGFALKCLKQAGRQPLCWTEGEQGWGVWGGSVALLGLKWHQRRPWICRSCPRFDLGRWRRSASDMRAQLQPQLRRNAGHICCLFLWLRGRGAALVPWAWIGLCFLPCAPLQGSQLIELRVGPQSGAVSEAADSQWPRFHQRSAKESEKFKVFMRSINLGHFTPLYFLKWDLFKKNENNRLILFIIYTWFMLTTFLMKMT